MFQISNATIETGGAPFIILEAGINHNGELARARGLIDAAKAAGADAVKFQTFKAAQFVASADQMFTYRSQGKTVTESMLEMFQRYEFSPEEWAALKAYCDASGITFMSTPQNVSDLDLLLEIGIPAIKIGSDDFTNLPLLRHYSQTGLPMLISCGMADLDEVRDSLEATHALSGAPVVLLLCTSQYPTPPEDVNIRKLATLRATFPHVILGFSDHTQGCTAAVLALGQGAVVFEKHFTLDHDLPGPDHWFSESPESAAAWIAAIREAHRMQGQAEVEPTPAEREMRVLARRSVTALLDIPVGASLTLENLGLRRPGDGLPPKALDQFLGKTATRPIASGAQLCWDDII
ncbi:N-acetylneuraminate synthase family protein [Anianabacter salinae]|uniref:N-acetylneuraminate synthase family protein n=1 Tax=Anianabacter salinae TaxID=2851023 RepID=UPI00225E63BE|nr:N-acetylneuraminate synthase family protein [Anianabacter salinae]MBV0914156.1 N-acetylneuraminate synthase family protein [Anianabacter salinae]